MNEKKVQVKQSRHDVDAHGAMMEEARRLREELNGLIEGGPGLISAKLFNLLKLRAVDRYVDEMKYFILQGNEQDALHDVEEIKNLISASRR